MSLAIQELRPESLSEAVEFARQQGSEVDGGRIVPALSLVAVEDAALVAAALCVEQKNGRHRMEIGIDSPERRCELNRTLVDKALMKLASAGIRKFDIRTNGTEAQREFWHAVSWIDQTLAADEPTAEPSTAADEAENDVSPVAGTSEAAASGASSEPLSEASGGLPGVPVAPLPS